MYTGIVYL